MQENSKDYKSYTILTHNALIFISSIIIISIIGNIKSKSTDDILDSNKKFFKESYKAISAIFSLQFILEFFYGIYFAIKCSGSIKNKIEERIILFFFLLLQFLHLIYCVIIPIYLNDFKYIINIIQKQHENEKELNLGVLDAIRSNYIGAICISCIFLIIFFFIDFILLLDYNQILDVGILFKFLGEYLCAGFNERQKITELKKEADKKTKEIGDIFANNLREDIKKILPNN